MRTAKITNVTLERRLVDLDPRSHSSPLVEVDVYVDTYASMRPPYFHEIGPKTARRCAAPQPVFTHYKLL